MDKMDLCADIKKNEKKNLKCAKYINSVTTVVHGSTPLSCSYSRLSDTSPQLHAVV